MDVDLPASDESRGACTTCLESDPPPIQGGCACRSDAGLAHVGCRVKAAESKTRMVNDDWRVCSTCKQKFTGSMQQQLSIALSARVHALPVSDEGREAARQFATLLEITVQLDGWQYAAAERNARGLHETMRTTHGDEHESTLSAASLVATALARQGRYDEAVRIQRAVIEASKHEIESSMTNVGFLASSLSNQGQYADAKRLYGEAVEMSTRVRGAEHMCTLTLRSNAALNLGRMGNYAEAADAARGLVAVYTRVLGAEHPSTISGKSVLASSLFSLGRREEAVQLEREVLASRKRLFGDEGPATLWSVDNLASMLERHGAYAEAEGLWRGLYAHRRSSLGEGSHLS